MSRERGLSRDVIIAFIEATLPLKSAALPAAIGAAAMLPPALPLLSAPPTNCGNGEERKNWDSQSSNFRNHIGMRAYCMIGRVKSRAVVPPPGCCHRPCGSEPVWGD